MKVSLTQRSLAAALDTARRVVKKPSVPILANVLLTASSSALAIRATDLDRQISLTIDAEVAVEGATSVPAHLLHDIVRKLPAGADVTLSVDGDGAQMTVSSGRSRFRLQCLPGSDFPQIRRDEEKQEFTLTGDQVRSLLGRTAFAISKEDTRFYLCGVFLHRGYESYRSPSDDLLTAVGTDGHRLAKSEIPAPEGTKGMPGVIIPALTVEEVLKLVGKRDIEVGILVSKESIEFVIDQTSLFSRLVYGSYPDYQRVIPINNGHTLRIDRGALASAVDRVSTVSSEKGRGIKFELGSELIRLSMSAPDAGTATEEIEAAFDGQPFEIGFNARYLGGILAELECETVECSLADPGSPTILRDPDDASRMCVLMPMRV